MFDIGIFEVSLVVVVALVVLGPKRLPKVARAVGSMMGKGQKLWRKAKAEFADLDKEADTRDDDA
jgi:sec-independent protein translocase protein TatB